VGPRAGLDGVERRKVLLLAPQRSSPLSVAIPTALSIIIIIIIIIITIIYYYYYYYYKVATVISLQSLVKLPIWLVLRPTYQRRLLLGSDSSAAYVVTKKYNIMSLFVSRFSPEVTSYDIKNSLEEMLKLFAFACNRLKSTLSMYA
jgi:hypothetical protein